MAEQNQENINIAVPKKLLVLLVAGFLVIAGILVVKAKALATEQALVKKSQDDYALKQFAEKKAREIGIAWADENFIPLGLDGSIASVNEDTVGAFLQSIAFNGETEVHPDATIKKVILFLKANYQENWWVFRIRYKETNYSRPIVVLIVKEGDSFRKLSGVEIPGGVDSH